MQPLEKKSGNIKFKNVSFSYNDNRSILKNISLDVPAGKKIAIVGPSGAGKSTIGRLLFRFYNSNKGIISIDGQNIINCTQFSLHENIAVVPQDTVLFNDTLHYNIAYGNPKAAENQIRAAAQSAQLDQFIEKLPKGFETRVGERGLKLSGGEKQRVAIARALAVNPAVLLMDEPLSNLDAKLRVSTRAQIKNLSHELAVTTIYVTHDQIEAMTLADRIAIMRDGKIMQLGSPAEIYDLPMNKYVADFIGSPSMNFIQGDIKGQCFTIGDHKIPLKNYSAKVDLNDGQKAWIGIRPEHVVVGEAAQKSDYNSTITADIVEPMGADTLVWSKFAGQPFRIRLGGTFPVSSGQKLHIGINASSVSLFDLQSEERL